jgi:hypothetical protein
MLRNYLALALLLCLGTATADANQSRSSRAERNKIEDLDDLSRRFNRQTAFRNLSPETEFLHARATALMDRARQAEAGSYLFGRLENTIDNLLDAVEEIAESEEDRNDGDSDTQERAAKDLERAYFRVRQGDYFARMSTEGDSKAYVKTAQALYQKGRGAYEMKQYRKARRLAEAAREVIDALEDLAQAAVRIPDPPQL